MPYEIYNPRTIACAKKYVKYTFLGTYLQHYLQLVYAFVVQQIIIKLQALIKKNYYYLR